MDLLTDTPTPPADSSPAPVSGQAVLDALSPADRLTWEQTGDLPTTPSKDAPADSSPVPSGDQTASTEAQAPPASEPGTPAKGEGLKKRSAELDTEIQSLQEKLRLRALLREELAQTTAKPDATPGSSPAPVSTDPKPTLKTFVERVGVEQGFETYEDAHEAFLEARDAWSTRQAESSARAQQQHQQLSDAGQAFSRRMEDAAKADPTLPAQIHPALHALKPYAAEQPGVPRGPQHDLAEALLTSEYPAQLMVHLSQHPDVYTRLLQSPNPFVLYREIGRLETTFSAQTSQARSPAPAPAPKPLSSAPPPPVTLGTKPGTTPEAWKDAVARGDFSAYEADQNSREIAATAAVSRR